MSDVKVATFNVKNLIGPDQEYYAFEQYTPEEYAWKRDWIARQLLMMNADVVCFQEIFDEGALWEVIEETNRRGLALNAMVLPDESKKYKNRKIFDRLSFVPYKRSQLRFAQNANDGEPGKRRPGLAILSRFGFKGKTSVIQTLKEPLKIRFSELDHSDAGGLTVSRLSRPIQRAVIPFHGKSVTIYNIHFKSKLGEYLKGPKDKFAKEADLTNYDPLGRAMGELRASTRRMSEALVLRDMVLDDLQKNRPAMVMGDFNDGENSVVTSIVSGERPFRNYSWMRRHDAKRRDDRYSKGENKKITSAIEKVRLTSAESHFVKRSTKDMIYSSAFGGVYESIDQILLSSHFDLENPKRIGEITYLSVFNDHLTDGSHPEAPYNKLASDHGQIVAHISLTYASKANKSDAT